MFGGERLGFADQVTVKTQSQVGFDPCVECRRAQLVEAGDLAVEHRPGFDVDVGVATPQCQRLP